MFTKMLNVGLIGMTVLSVLSMQSTVKELKRMNCKLETATETIMYRPDYMPTMEERNRFRELKKLADSYYTL